MGRAERTGIELLAVGLECALVVDLDFVALLCLAFALDRQCHVDLEVVGQDTDSGRGKQREREERKLHFGRCGR